MSSDLRYAFRQLAKSPGFTAVAILTLGLGIGATATTFCWLQNMVDNPLPGVPRQERMAVLTVARGKSVWDTISLPDIADARELRNVFAGVIGSQVTPACLTDGDKPEWIYGQIATSNFFDVLGVKPLHGQTFLAANDAEKGANPVVVLSETYWRKRFNGDPAVIGRVVRINQHPFTIIGVVPATFLGTMSGLRCDFWAPVSMHGEVANFGSLQYREYRWLHTQVRLQPGVTLAAAQAVLDAFSAREEQTYPRTNREFRFLVLPFSQAPYGIQPKLVGVLRILLVVSIGVLLIVAANLASLLLARATVRRREIAIRLSLGATRARLIRQLLTESLLLAAAGGILGILLAFWAVDILVAWLPVSYLPLSLAFSINGPTLLFTLGLAAVTGVVFGLVPALQASRPDLTAALKEGGSGSGTGGGHQRLRRLLAIAEVALALTLLIGAGLCVKSLRRAEAADLGFRPDRVLLGGLRIGMNGYDEQTGKIFYRELRQRLAAMPGVEAVGLAGNFPMGLERCGSHGVAVDGYVRQPGEDTNIQTTMVSPGYFETLRIPLLAGRDFTERDDQDAPGVAVINEAMAKRFWPGQDAIGRKFLDGGRPTTVIGVTKTGKYNYTLNEPPSGFFYRPFMQGVPELNLAVGVRTSGDPAAFAETLRREVRRLDPRVELWLTGSMTDYIKPAFLVHQLASRLLEGLGLVALVLAALGVYGVMSYVVNQRTREFGVRLALGATARDLLGMILREGMVLAAVGTVAGLGLAFLTARGLTAVLYGVDPFDPMVFAGVPLLLAAAMLLACWLPARRATRVNPVEALRAE
jgi:predicted permease